MNPLPPVQEILEQFNYDPETGIFTHAYPKRGRRRADGHAGFRGPNEYVYLRVSGHPFLAHRLAWKIIYGTDPEREVDHKNTVRTDNRKDNLRLANEAQQSWNSKKPRTNTSGFKGASWIPKKRRWAAYITHLGVRKYLGMYVRVEDAHAAYVAAAEKLFGEYANAG